MKGVKKVHPFRTNSRLEKFANRFLTRRGRGREASRSGESTRRGIKKGKKEKKARAKFTLLNETRTRVDSRGYDLSRYASRKGKKETCKIRVDCDVIN